MDIDSADLEPVGPPEVQIHTSTGVVIGLLVEGVVIASGHAVRVRNDAHATLLGLRLDERGLPLSAAVGEVR